MRLDLSSLCVLIFIKASIYYKCGLFLSTFILCYFYAFHDFYMFRLSMFRLSNYNAKMMSILLDF